MIIAIASLCVERIKCGNMHADLCHNSVWVCGSVQKIVTAIIYFSEKSEALAIITKCFQVTPQ